jgi:sporulation protein YlmC with PRC-barrel domain
MTQNLSHDVLHRIADTELMLGNREQDVRGFKVIDRHDKQIGMVSDLFVDEPEQKVRMLEISAGGFLGIGARHVLLPVDAITAVEKSEVHVNQSREHVAASPAYSPDLISRPAREYLEPFYGYYGLMPYWGAGYMYPQFLLRSADPSAVTAHLKPEIRD